MDKFVVRRAIKEIGTENVIGYELMLQGGSDTLYEQAENVAADSIADFFMNNSHKIFRDKMTFITLTPSLLFRNVPRVFDKEKVVIQIEDNLIIHPLAMPIMKKYHNEGYKFAINDFRFTPKYMSFLEYAEYIRIKVSADDSDADRSSVENVIQMAKGFDKKCIATDLETEADYELAKSMGADYLQGSYIAENLTEKADKVTFMQGNFFQLIAAVAKDEPDMAEIEAIVSRDAGLTYAILKLVNSAFFALRRRTASIRQALVTLGIGQLRQWVYMLSFKQDSMNGTEEMLKLSFLRATFAQELVKYVEDCPLTKTEAYMMGMFSTLDYMINAPLAEILAEIPINEEIKEALTDGEGRAGKLYQMVICYEKADWKHCQQLAEELGVQISIMSQCYINCVEEVNSIWENLMTDFPRPDEEKVFREDSSGKERIEDAFR